MKFLFILFVFCFCFNEVISVSNSATINNAVIISSTSTHSSSSKETKLYRENAILAIRPDNSTDTESHGLVIFVNTMVKDKDVIKVVLEYMIDNCNMSLAKFDRSQFENSTEPIPDDDDDDYPFFALNVEFEEALQEANLPIQHYKNITGFLNILGIRNAEEEYESEDTEKGDHLWDGMIEVFFVEADIAIPKYLPEGKTIHDLIQENTESIQCAADGLFLAFPSSVGTLNTTSILTLLFVIILIFL